MTGKIVSLPVFFETHDISPPHIMKKNQTEATAVSIADDVGWKWPFLDNFGKFHRGDY